MHADNSPAEHRFIQINVDCGAGHVPDPTRRLLTAFARLDWQAPTDPPNCARNVGDGRGMINWASEPSQQLRGRPEIYRLWASANVNSAVSVFALNSAQVGPIPTLTLLAKSGSGRRTGALEMRSGPCTAA